MTPKEYREAHKELLLKYFEEQLRAVEEQIVKVLLDEYQTRVNVHSQHPQEIGESCVRREEQ